MKRLIRFSIENSMFVNLLSVFIVVYGIFSMFLLNREAFPPIDFNIVTITTIFRGADPQSVEKLVTSRIEKEIKSVSYIKRIVSRSITGVSLISVEIEHDVRDVDSVVDDIQKAVDRVTNLPDEVEDRPLVKKLNAGEIPILRVAVSSNELSPFEINQYADRLEDILEETKGVSYVDKVGYREEEYWVELDMDKMLRRHVSFREVAGALAAQNVDLPGGKMDISDSEIKVRVDSELLAKEDIENTVIRANDLGAGLKVKDIANVRHRLKEENTITRANGRNAVVLTVVKKEEGDIIDTVDAVEHALSLFRKRIPEGLTIESYDDLSFYVKRRLGVLRSNGILGFILVVAALFLFLPPIPAIFTAIGIPMAICVTFIVMNYLGLSINLITMFGMVMVLGIVVDDGIIISENVFRHIEMGETPKQAAFNGVSEVALPVISTVITTVVAFSPLMFMGGVLGKFVRFIPMIVITALAGSLVESLFILPSHLADFIHPMGGAGRKKRRRRWLRVVMDMYAHLLDFALKFRYVLLGVMLISLIGLIAFAVKKIPFILFSAKGTEAVVVSLEAEPGISLDKMNKFTLAMEKVVESLGDDYLDDYETTVGSAPDPYGRGGNGSREGSNYSQISVMLTPFNKRDKTAAQLIAEMRPGVRQILKEYKPQGLRDILVKMVKEGPKVGAAVDVAIRGDNWEVLMDIAGQIKAFLSGMKGVTDISDTYVIGGKETRIVIDENKAREAMISNAEVAYAIRAAFSGVVATTIKKAKAEDEIDVLVRLPISTRNSRDVFDKILISNRMGNLVPLNEIARIEYVDAIQAINHLDGKRSVEVTAEVDNKNMTSVKANRILKNRFSDIPKQYPGYTIRFLGENEESMESMRNLAKAFLMALLLIFIILATQFNSLSQPFIIMLAIPFAVIGVIIALIIHKDPVSFFTIMGSIGLTGIVVNDSIVMIDFINKRIASGVRAFNAVKGAAIARFRPIMVTTITTILGLGTVAYGIGGADPFLMPMALAMSWGLLFSTFLTLLLVPCLFLILNDVKSLSGHGNR